MSETKKGTYFEEGKLDVSEEKICPLLIHHISGVSEPITESCKKEKCAWYDEVHNCCAILIMIRGK